jgi:menaquinol-cytochrome c reductase iron-sulfur subunit
MQSETEQTVSRERRSFLGVLIGVGTVGMGTLLSIPLVRFALHPILAKTTETAWSDLGAADKFASLASPVKLLIKVEQRDGWRKIISEKSVYVTKSADGQLRVMSSICPHLGCSITWNDARTQFICPCHVGVFSPDGALVSGPPPRGMDELETKVEDGRLKARYQYFRQLTPTKEVIA